MAPSAVVTRNYINLLGSSSSSSSNTQNVQRITTPTNHGFSVGQVLKRFPNWALACADLEENCGEYIVLKTGPRFFEIANFNGIYDLVSGFSNNDSGKNIYLDWRPANTGAMTLEKPPGFEYCQCLGKVIDSEKILIRPEPITISENMGVGIINLPNHGITKGQVFDRDGNSVRLASTATNNFFLGNLLAGRVTTNQIWYPTTPTEYDFNNHGWTVGQIYYVGPTPGIPTTVAPSSGQNPLRQLPLFVPVSPNRILYIRAFQPT